MTRLKYAQILDKRFQDALKRLGDKELPVPVSLRLVEVIRVVGVEIEKFEAVRQSLVRLYAEKDANGQPQVAEDFTYIMADRDNFDKKFNELLSAEAEVPQIGASQIQGVNISANDLAVLLPLLSNES